MSSVAGRDYLAYLKAQVGIDPENYKGLLTLMFEKEFVWIVPNDDNRIADGLELRAEWLEINGIVSSIESCSFLEVLVGLSRRMAFVMDEPAEGWAGQLMINLGLDKLSDDRFFSQGKRQANEILDAVIWRTYKPDGTGGFFPLSKPQQDQTEIEIWFQMSEYTLEIHPEF